MKNILMNTEMTKAILDGRKTNTRRVAITQKGKTVINANFINGYKNMGWDITKTAKYQKGETIWVREPAKVTYSCDFSMEMTYKYLASKEYKTIDIPKRFQYMTDNDKETTIIKPKWITECQGIPNGCIKEMARIFLKVTDVRAELLQDITFGDIIKEGYPYEHNLNHDDLNTKAILAVHNDEVAMLDWWIKLWDSTAKGEYKWANNPYTFVNGLKRVENG